MDILINKAWFKWIILLAVVVACGAYIYNNPDAQASIKEFLRTIYVTP